MGMIEGLRVAATHPSFTVVPTAAIKIISDSQYSINTLTIWGPQWVAQGERDKMNMDLVVPALALLADVRRQRPVEFIHVNSHVDEPADIESMEWVLWRGNVIADACCTGLLAEK